MFSYGYIFHKHIILVFLDEAAEEEYDITIDGEEYTVYVIDTNEDEEYTFDDETPFDTYTIDVSAFKKVQL